jgi:L-asparaginase/Glu-tRNA(Gln) amidotransferase subunit D
MSVVRNPPAQNQKIAYGTFDAEIAGDLSGFNENSSEDIETPVAPMVGQVEVYKVHHGSRYSSNEAWLAAIQPRIGIISAGDGNGHRHPTEESLERLHTAGVQVVLDFARVSARLQLSRMYANRIVGGKSHPMRGETRKVINNGVPIA